MKLEEVKSLFTLAGIPILATWELMNDYWPRSAVHYHKLIIESPWWLVKTPVGLIKIGWRKRVISIEWEDTPIRKIITEDSVTKNQTMVHAWEMKKVLEYLTALAAEMPKEVP